MATTSIAYSGNNTITMDLASVATSPTFLAGRESLQIDNTVNKYMDCLVSGFVSVGGTANNITPNTVIAVYVWGAETSLATTPLDALDGTDSTVSSLTNSGILNALRLGATVAVPANTSDVRYIVLPFSVAALFGGVVPKFWGLYVTHNTGQNLRSTTNTNQFEFVGVKYDIA
jgi:hypothetical protein